MQSDRCERHLSCLVKEPEESKNFWYLQRFLIEHMIHNDHSEKSGIMNTVSWYINREMQDEKYAALREKLTLLLDFIGTYCSFIDHLSCTRCRRPMTHHYVMDEIGGPWGGMSEASGNIFNVCETCKDELLRPPNLESHFIVRENTMRFSPQYRLTEQELEKIFALRIEKVDLPPDTKINCRNHTPPLLTIADLYYWKANTTDTAVTALFTSLRLPLREWHLPWEVVMSMNLPKWILKKLMTARIYTLPQLMARTHKDLRKAHLGEKEIEEIEKRLALYKCSLSKSSITSSSSLTDQAQMIQSSE